ncbi:MAG: GFA family protein [Halieaceae bacterium]|nr:GFA family protein [Halieaceae bacterium]
MQKLTGRCLCEEIEYEITGEIGPIYNCHCSRCRRWHGAAFRTRSTINKSQFTWTKGEELLSKFYSSPATAKTFCSICGSNLISLYDEEPDKIGFPLGGLDQAPSNTIEGHFFVGSKAPWHEISDDVDQYDEFPRSRRTVRATE